MSEPSAATFPITIDSTQAITDYQVKVTLNSSFDWSSVAADGSDIAFYDSDNSPLYFWIEEWNYGSSATIWVKVPSIPSGQKTIYLVTDDAATHSAYCNPEETFIIYEDFDSTPSDWTTIGNWTISGGVASTPDNPGHMYTSSDITNAVWEFRGRRGVSNACDIGLMVLSNSVTHGVGDYYLFRAYGGGPLPLYKYIDGSYVSTVAQGTAPSDENFHIFTLKRYNGNWKLLVDGVEAASGTDNELTTSQYLVMIASNGSACTMASEYDWIRVRKYIEPEPVATLSGEEDSPDNSPDNFTRIADIPVARTDSVSFAIGNYGYVGLGYNGNYLSDFWRYDPSTNTWTQVADFPGGARDGAVAFAIGNYGYVGLGKTDSGYMKDFWRYDPSTNTWTQVADFPGDARRGAVAFVVNGKAYVGLGDQRNPDVYFSDFYCYDPSTNTWTQVADFPGGARENALAFAVAGYGFVGCGQTIDHADHKDFWRYDPSTNTWTQITSDFGGADRENGVGWAIGNYGYFGFGNSDELGNTHTKDIWRFNPATNTFTRLDDFPGNARSKPAVFVIGNTAYIGAGNSGSTLFSDFYAFTVQTSSTSAPTPPTDISFDKTEYYVGNTIVATASGSTDPDGDPVAYYYKFVVDGVTKQDYSTDYTYTIAQADAHKQIQVCAKAYDGQEYSSEYCELIPDGYVQNSKPVPSSYDTDKDAYNVGETITATSTWTDADGDTITKQYKFYDYTTSTTLQNWGTDNTYTVTDAEEGHTIIVYFRAHDGFEYSDEYSKAVTVGTQENPPEITSFSPSSTTLTVEIGDTVQFSATADQSIDTWFWSGVDSYTGDGSTTTTAEKTFTTPGTATVSVYGVNANGVTQTVTWHISVEDSAESSTPRLYWKDAGYLAWGGTYCGESGDVKLGSTVYFVAKDEDRILNGTLTINGVSVGEFNGKEIAYNFLEEGTYEIDVVNPDQPLSNTPITINVTKSEGAEGYFAMYISFVKRLPPLTGNITFDTALYAFFVVPVAVAVVVRVGGVILTRGG